MDLGQCVPGRRTGLTRCAEVDRGCVESVVDLGRRGQGPACAGPRRPREGFGFNLGKQRVSQLVTLACCEPGPRTRPCSQP